MLELKSDPKLGGSYIVGEVDLLVGGERHRVPMRYDSSSKGFACTGCRAVVAALGLQVSRRHGSRPSCAQRPALSVVILYRTAPALEFYFGVFAPPYILLRESSL